MPDCDASVNRATLDARLKPRPTTYALLKKMGALKGVSLWVGSPDSGGSEGARDD